MGCGTRSSNHPSVVRVASAWAAHQTRLTNLSSAMVPRNAQGRGRGRGVSLFRLSGPALATMLTNDILAVRCGTRSRNPRQCCARCLRGGCSSHRPTFGRTLYTHVQQGRHARSTGSCWRITPFLGEILMKESTGRSGRLEDDCAFQLSFISQCRREARGARSYFFTRFG